MCRVRGCLPHSYYQILICSYRLMEDHCLGKSVAKVRFLLGAQFLNRAVILRIMETKICSGCKLPFELERFNRNKSMKDGRSRYCKTCQGIKQKAYYNGEAKTGYISGIKESARIRNERNVAYVNEIKARPCSDCGGTFPPVCMDFDHLPGFVKRENVSIMVASGLSLKAIQEEIDKCELVCSNCHRIRTSIREPISATS